MRYVYPVVFKQEENQYSVSVPDLDGCFTFGDSLFEAIEMARDAMAMWLCKAEDNNEVLPQASKAEDIKTNEGFINFIDVDTQEYRRLNDNRAIKKTLSVPSWLNAKAERAGINFSQVLQDALKVKLNIE